MEYLPTIGLEIHAELKTRTKMFCDSRNDPDETRPNANVCPICLGHPGTLPVINKEAVRKALLVGAALHGTIADFTEFDRKNYFYPDIPKGYQISQYKHPLVTGGTLNGVAITRVHLEEDTGTLIHADTETQMNADWESSAIRDNLRFHPRESASLVDFNRAGVPLMELVTEPVIHCAKDAGDFARELQLLLRYLGASDANMEKGEMRVEANISVRPEIVDSRGLPCARIDADKEKSNGKLLYEELSYKIRGAVFNVRNALGSGHKEFVYQSALIKEFEKNDIKYEKEKIVNVLYNKENVGSYRPDFVINGKIILELKVLPFIGKKEKEQLWHYLKGSDYRLALIVNFGSAQLQIERVVFDSIRDNPRLYPRESASMGTKVEVKNLNSFRAVERAIEYEVGRQKDMLEAGETVIQETRGWDDAAQRTFAQRRKEESHDYRYFPEPDLPKLRLRFIHSFTPEALTAALPELPVARRERLTREFCIKKEDAELFTVNRALGDFFEETAKKLKQQDSVLLAANYLTSDIMGLLRKAGANVDSVEFTFSAAEFSELMRMVERKKISSRGAKDILSVMFEKGGEPNALALELCLFQKSDVGELKRIVSNIILVNPKVAEDYKNGKQAALQFLVGQGMKETKGAANPSVLRELFSEQLK